MQEKRGPEQNKKYQGERDYNANQDKNKNNRRRGLWAIFFILKDEEDPRTWFVRSTGRFITFRGIDGLGGAFFEGVLIRKI